jgi:hypothetical protein
LILLRKNPDDGICNLCLNKFDSLSEDHIPPRCTGNNGEGIYSNCFANLPILTIPTNEYSKGISYRTICHDCNNLLGKRYDKSISKFYGTVRHSSKKENIEMIVRPNAIMRGIMGHFIAAKTTHKLSTADEIFRKYAIQPECEIPDEIHFYVIFSPFKEIRIIRDIMMMAGTNTKNASILNIIKIDPIAIVISDKPFLGSIFMDWNCYRNIYWQKEVKIILNPNDFLPHGMPENDSRFVRLLGQYAYESICATIKKRTG